MQQQLQPYLQLQPGLARQHSPAHSAEQDTWFPQLGTDELRAEVKRFVPPLTNDVWKGANGKVGVLGSCSEYTGASYFVAMAALKVGADLAHVFTTKSAAPIIKAYSPELIVHPYFLELSDLQAQEAGEERTAAYIRDTVAEVEAWFSRLDCLVVGPGLGRDPLLLDVARACIARARLVGLPLVLDGDGLFLVAREPELVLGYKACVLTPNLNEFRRLATTLGISLHGPHNDRLKKLADVTRQLAGPVMISKGPSDAVHDGRTALLCNANAGQRRCGGQGDILSGVLATFVSWVSSFLERQKAGGDNNSSLEINPLLLACFGACLTTRTACSLAFATKRRSMLAGDVLEQLGVSIEDLFDNPTTTGGVVSAEGRKGVGSILDWH